MFNLIFLLTFNTALTVANIYFFKTKRYLYLFIPCMLFLPAYYGISPNNSLPAISVARCMFLILYVYTFLNKRRTIDIKSIRKQKLEPAYYLLGGYFIFRIASNLYYVTTHGAAVKAILLIIFEHLMLLVSIYLLAPTKEEVNTIIKAVVWSATVLFIVGLIESFTSFRPFDALYTSLKYMLNDHYTRLGLLRSTTTMGLPGKYGNMCVIVLILIIYLFKTTNEKKYLFIIPLDVLAVIHSGARSDILYLFFILGIYTILFCRSKKDFFLLLKNAGLIVVTLGIVISLLMISSEKYNYYYSGTAKSILNELGANFDLNADAPEGIEGYGENQKSGSNSRIVQFTGIKYTMSKNPIFGLGSGADERTDLHYFWNHRWYIAHWYDVGIVEVICEEGILGLIAYVCLMLAIVIFLFRMYRNDILTAKYGILYLLTFLVTTLSTVNLYPFILLLVSYCTLEFPALKSESK